MRGIRRLISQRKVTILFLQETKKSVINSQLINSIWPNPNPSFATVDALGFSGGILCVWDKTRFSVSDCIKGSHFILLKGTICSTFECVLVNVYAPNDAIERNLLWEELLNLKSSCDLPWCIGRDFNEIVKIGEKKGMLKIIS